MMLGNIVGVDAERGRDRAARLPGGDPGRTRLDPRRGGRRGRHRACWEAYTGGYVGHGLNLVVPYVVLILVLMVRPYGLFGKEIIERV